MIMDPSFFVSIWDFPRISDACEMGRKGEELEMMMMMMRK